MVAGVGRSSSSSPSLPTATRYREEPSNRFDGGASRCVSVCVCVCSAARRPPLSPKLVSLKPPHTACLALQSAAVTSEEPHHVVHILANGKRRASWQQEAPPPLLLLLLPLPLQRLLPPANGGQLAGQVPRQSCGVIIMSFLWSRGSLCSAARSQICFIKDEMLLKSASDQIHAVLATPPWLLHSRSLKYPMCVFLPCHAFLYCFCLYDDDSR